ncbi:MAG: aspartyl protease family protein [Candidatus Eiseniibacteriota bacterium]
MISGWKRPRQPIPGFFGFFALLAAAAGLFLGVSPVESGPKVIGKTEPGVRVLRGSGSGNSGETGVPPSPALPAPGAAGATTSSPATGAQGAGSGVGTSHTPPPWTGMSAPPAANNDAAAIELARRLVQGYGGPRALEAWAERGERTGRHTVLAPARVEARIRERRRGDRIRMDVSTGGYDISMAVGPGGGWQQFIGLVTDLPDVQRQELEVAHAHDEDLLLEAAAKRAPATVLRDADPDALLVWGSRGSPTLFAPDVSGQRLARVEFLDRSALRGEDVFHTVTVHDWRELSPDKKGERGPTGARVPFGSKHSIDGQLVEESQIESVDLLATFEDSVFARPGAVETVVGESKRSVVRLERHGGHHFVPVSIGGAAPRTFLVDTGAGLTAISYELADTLGLTLGEPMGIVGLGGGTNARTATLPRIGLGSLSRTNVQCLVIDFSELRTGLGIPVEGILGFSALNRYAVTFDFALGTLELAENSPPQELGDGSARVRFEIVGGLPQIEARVDGGDPISFIVDTGAFRTFVPRTTGEAIATTARVPGIPFVGADGRALEGVAVRARSLTVGTAEVARPIVLYASSPATNDPVGITLASGDRGVLGSDILRRFRVTLDYPRSELVLEPPGKGGVTRLDVEPETDGLIGPGLVPVREGTTYRVQAVIAGSPAERAGVRVGDRLIAIDGREIAGLSTSDVLSMLSGGRGTRVKVRVRTGGEAVRAVELERVDLL